MINFLQTAPTNLWILFICAIYRACVARLRSRYLDQWNYHKSVETLRPQGCPCCARNATAQGLRVSTDGSYLGLSTQLLYRIWDSYHKTLGMKSVLPKLYL
jgi:hypothetical protein